MSDAPPAFTVEAGEGIATVTEKGAPVLPDRVCDGLPEPPCAS